MTKVVCDKVVRDTKLCVCVTQLCVCDKDVRDQVVSDKNVCACVCDKVV